jgi:hypothetical protein
MEFRLIAASTLILAVTAVVSSAAVSDISLSAYAKRADAVCSDYRWKVDQLPRPAPSAFAEEVSFARAVQTIVVDDNRKLHSIPLPVAKRRIVRDWVAGHDRIPRLLDSFRLAAQKKNLNLLEVANAALVANGAHGRSLARQLGMKVCSDT